MSIILGKRGFKETDFTTDIQSLDKLKRLKYNQQNIYPAQNDSISLIFQNPIQKLKILFPRMDDQALQNILEECDYNIEKAIESLTNLTIDDSSPMSTTEDQQNDYESRHLDIISTKIRDQKFHKYKLKKPPAEVVKQEEGQLQTANDYAIALVKHLKNVRNEDEALNLANMAFVSFEDKKDSKTSVIEEENLELKKNLKSLIKDNTTLKRAYLLLNSKYQAGVGSVIQENEELRQQLAECQEAYRKEKNANLQLQMFLGTDSCWKNNFTHENNPDIF